MKNVIAGLDERSKYSRTNDIRGYCSYVKTLKRMGDANAVKTRRTYELSFSHRIVDVEITSKFLTVIQSTFQNILHIYKGVTTNI